jgi:hypothetical protein
MEMRVELASQETHFASCLPRDKDRTIRHRPFVATQYRDFLRVDRKTGRTRAIGRQLPPTMIKRYAVI